LKVTHTEYLFIFKGFFHIIVRPRVVVKCELSRELFKIKW